MSPSLSRSADADRPGNRYWLALVGYLAVTVVGAALLVAVVVETGSVTDFGVALVAVAGVVVVAAAASVPALVADAVGLARDGAWVPRWYLYVAAETALPVGTYLVADAAVPSTVAALAAAAALVAVTVVGSGQYLAHRRRNVGLR
ncbi:hypothetical protein [Halobaculum sp. D14]|uniref:hypothetical protein n=1 Tax=unclassified Halobaculum TaxID=2640896 RepID=UPI003EBC96CB